MDDLSVLSKSKRELLGSEFHYRDNYAGVLLSYKGKPVQRGKVNEYVSSEIGRQRIVKLLKS